MRIDPIFVLACVVFAAATYVKATLTILPPLLFAVAAWSNGATRRRTTTLLLAAGCLYAALLSPWWIRNAVLLDHFVPFTTSSAMNLYLGNNHHNPDVGNDWSSDVELDVVANIAALPNEIARQRAFNEMAHAYVAAHPVTFVRNTLRKLVRFWNVIPNAAEFRGGIYASISLASFGSVLLLAIVAFISGWKSRRSMMPLLLILGYFTAVYRVTIASLRYRLPLEPLLIAVAAQPAAKAHGRHRPHTSDGAEIVIIGSWLSNLRAPAKQDGVMTSWTSLCAALRVC